MRNLSEARHADNLAEWHRQNGRFGLNVIRPMPFGRVARTRRSSDTGGSIERWVSAMRKWIATGAFAAAVSAGCVTTPSLDGSFGAPSFAALQDMCATASTDWGADAQSVYSAFF